MLKDAKHKRALANQLEGDRSESEIGAMVDSCSNKPIKST